MRRLPSEEEGKKLALCSRAALHSLSFSVMMKKKKRTTSKVINRPNFCDEAEEETVQ